MEEIIVSGYCRMLDGSRMVTGEVADGRCCFDCSYGACPHEQSCPIAEKLRIWEKDRA